MGEIKKKCIKIDFFQWVRLKKNVLKLISSNGQGGQRQRRTFHRL